MSGLTDKEIKLATDYLMRKNWGAKIYILPGPDLMGDKLIGKEVNGKVTVIAHADEKQIQAYAKEQENFLRNHSMAKSEPSLNDLVDVPLQHDAQKSKQKLDDKPQEVRQARSELNKENKVETRGRSNVNSAAPPRPKFGG